MSIRCFFRYPEGHYCKKWAMRDSRFCHNHQPPNLRSRSEPLDSLHPFVRLSTPKDIFNLVRDALNATHLGTMAPAQAYAVGYLATLWLKLHSQLDWHGRQNALREQILPTLVDAQFAVSAELEAEGDAAHLAAQRDAAINRDLELVAAQAAQAAAQSALPSDGRGGSVTRPLNDDAPSASPAPDELAGSASRTGSREAVPRTTLHPGEGTALAVPKATGPEHPTLLPQADAEGARPSASNASAKAAAKPHRPDNGAKISRAETEAILRSLLAPLRAPSKDSG